MLILDNIIKNRKRKFIKIGRFDKNKGNGTDNFRIF